MRITQRRAHLIAVAAAHSKVEFIVPNCPLEYGECIKVVGSEIGLGDWDAAQGILLQWSEGNHWTGSVELPQSAQLQFKLIKSSLEGDTVIWEDGPNREIVVPSGGSTRITCQFGAPGSTVLESVAQELRRYPGRP